jgi:hypothetical protein
LMTLAARPSQSTRHGGEVSFHCYPESSDDFK